MNIHAKLSIEEEREFRQWARDNYTPGSVIKQSWHPATQAECHMMNVDRLQGEYDLILDSDPRSDNQVEALAQVEIDEKIPRETFI